MDKEGRKQQQWISSLRYRDQYLEYRGGKEELRFVARKEREKPDHPLRFD